MPRRLAPLMLVALACGSPSTVPDAGRDASPPTPTLHAAARTVDITPTLPIEIVGYGARTATDVRDPLDATVLILRGDTTAVALVAMDLPGIHAWPAAQLRRVVASAGGVPYENVIVAASHTHSAPMLGDDAWSAATIDAVARAANDAAAALAPARVRYGASTVAFCVNRRLVVDGVAVARPNPDGPNDDRVRVLRFEADGAPIADVVHATCHPNVLLGVESTRVSADFPGVPRAATPTVFLQGAAGDVRPMVVDDDGAFRLGTDADLERIGAELDATVDAALRDAAPVTTPELDAARTLLALPRRAPDGATLDAELHAVRVGHVVLTTIPGEPFVDVGLDVERAIQTRAPDTEVLVIGYANGYLDYIVTPEAEPFGGYEVERSLLHPEAAAAIVEASSALAGAL